MRFYDEATIHLESWKWGDGVVCGRRETGIPFGGPSGGDGGKGGSIFFEANSNENTLIPYKYKRHFKSKYGEPGRSKDQYGAHAADLVLPVPVGTLVKDAKTGAILHVFSKDQERREAVKGGQGGVGNIHFKDAIHQYPQFCLLGEPGQVQDFTLELQLLADIGLIGTPSVGKSSLINTVSHAKAKVGDYPFTTIVPNLGSIQHLDEHFNMIDIPGLIKGAAQGKGLGNAFLRHILKARIFCLVADLNRFESGMLEITDLLEEIFIYIETKFPDAKITFRQEEKAIVLSVDQDNTIILEKKIIFALNKWDLIQDEDILAEYKKAFFADILRFFKQKKVGKDITEKALEANTYTVSAATHYGITQWLDAVVTLLRSTSMQQAYHLELAHFAAESPEESTEKTAMMIKDISEIELPFLVENEYIEEAQAKYLHVWEVRDQELCRLIWMLPWGNDEAEKRFWQLLDHKKTIALFEQSGIRKGDILKIMSFYGEKEDRYIMY